MRKFILFYACCLILAAGCGGAPEPRTLPMDQPAGVQDSASGGEGSLQEEASPAQKGRVLFFGNSLTAGYGLDPEQAFPAIIQKKIDSARLPYEVVNAGLSGETSSAGLNRVDWILRQRVDVFVLELGANDGLRGIPVAETRKNLASIIARVREKYPDALVALAGMQVPPNMGPEYSAAFREMFPALAREFEILLIPFLLEGVGGVPALNLPDGIHPNAEGHQLVAENIWRVLGPALIQRSGRAGTGPGAY